MRFLLCIISAVLFATWAQAHVPPTGSAYAKAVFARFDELLRQRQAEGRLPSLEDAGDRGILSKIWDGDALIGLPPYDAGDLDSLSLVMDKAGSLAALYNQVKPVPPQDELTRTMALLIRAAAASQPAFDDVLARQSNVAELLRNNGAKARGAIEKMFRGALIFLSDPALKDENRMILVETLKSAAPYLAQSVSADRRQAVADSFAPLAGQLSAPAKASLEIVMQEIKEADCNRVCANGR